MGAPTATPSAYIVMSWPAVEILTCKSLATFGKIPIITNSVIPIAKAPTVRESIEMGKGSFPARSLRDCALLRFGIAFMMPMFNLSSACNEAPPWLR